MSSGNAEFDSELARMAATFKGKNHDYAKDADPWSNFRKSEELGIPMWKGALLRMSDKWSRLVELANKAAAVKDESFEDTLLDLANYACICRILRKHRDEKAEDV